MHITNISMAFILLLYPVFLLFIFLSAHVISSFIRNYSSAPLLRFFISIAQAAFSIPVAFR